LLSTVGSWPSCECQRVTGTRSEGLTALSAIRPVTSSYLWQLDIPG
jgi:hypothetical protein